MKIKHCLDHTGRPIDLGERIGSGGEGDVYEVTGTPDRVAKVYKSQVPKDKADKLAAMVAQTSSELTQFAAWPSALLVSPRDRTPIGIVMPRISAAREIHELYSPAQRKIHFQRADWRFLTRAARNCAAAFDTLHRHGIVIGDVNQGNVFVSARALVTLIDCDSFQFSNNGHTYLCRVGVPHFTPPELQSENLGKVVRTANHDGFGLALLVFHLLFMGRHPFAGRFLGNGDMPIERAIREERFAYGRTAARVQMQPPPNALTLQDVPGEIAMLFERAFARGNRPAAAEWGSALERLEKSLRQCDDDPGHYYIGSARDCPWCRIAAAGGPNLFISVTVHALTGREGTFDISAVWGEVQRVARPDHALPALQRYKSPHKPRSYRQWLKGITDFQSLLGWVSLASLGLTPLAIIFHVTALFTVPMAALFGGWWALLFLTSPVWRERAHAKAKVSAIRSAHRKCESDYYAVVSGHAQRFDSKLKSLEMSKKLLSDLQRRKDEELQAMRTKANERQLEEYLKTHFISAAAISGIGPVRVAALESYGIETAYDLTILSPNSVPGFGPTLTANLEVWFHTVTASFRFDPSKGVPPAVLQALDVKYLQLRVQHERTLRRGSSELAQITTAAAAEGKRLYARVLEVREDLAQAEVALHDIHA